MRTFVPAVAQHTHVVELDPLLHTKLTPPPRTHLVPRPRLTNSLDHQPPASLTLVVAPAGYGKTTLLANWACGQQWPVAWLALEDADNDPHRFWRYLIAAIQTAHPQLGAAALVLLESSHPLTSTTPLTALLNDIAAWAETIVLILDDYHVIDNATIHHGMAWVLEHAPANIHLIIAGRAVPPLPLDRLRADGRLVDIDAAQLRCTVAESSLFLRETMRLPIDDQAAHMLAERTEGWFAGLQLTALALRGQPDLPSAVRSVAGTQRLIAGYLLEEVLRQQSPEIQAFLLRTSILGRLCGELCDAVLGIENAELRMQNNQTQHSDSQFSILNSQFTLEQLERANLFLVPLDGEGRWYRYHQLFAELLRDQLARRDPALPPMLHRRAAAWYAAQGMLPDAIEHALMVGDQAQAADLIGQAADALWLRGELATLGRWLEALPKMLLLQQPILVFMQIWTLLNSGQVHTAAGALADAEQHLNSHTGDLATGPASGHGGVQSPDELAMLLATLRVLLALAQEQPPPALPALGDDLARWHWLTVLHVGFAAWASGALAQARQALTQALTRPQAVADGTRRLLARCYLADLDRQAGHLAQAADGYQQLLDGPADAGQPRPPVLSYVLLGMGAIAYETNDLDSAAVWIETSIDLARRGGKTDAVLEAQIATAWVQQARGDAARARATMAVAVQTARRWQLPIYRTIALAQQARLALVQGDLAAARRWARTCGLTLDEVGGGPREVVYLILARVLIALEQCDAALAWLARIQALALADGRVGRAIEALALTALAQQARGQIEPARVALQSALVAAEPAGYIRLFVDEGAPMRLQIADCRLQIVRHPRSIDTGHVLAYIDGLLAAFPETMNDERRTTKKAPPRSSLIVHPLVEPLTPRELVVLRAVAAGLANRAIAAQLSVTAGTVKWYLEQVYSKLAVHNRIQAVAQARALGLIE